MVDTGICQFKRKCLQRITLRIRNVTGFFHLTEYDITTSQRIFTDFRVSGYRIITGRILAHSHKHRRLFYLQIFGLASEISRCSRFYTDSIIQEVELIEIHRQNFFFRIVTFQFHGNHPFDRLLQQTLDGIACHFFRKQLFCQLLWDRTTPTRAFLQQQTTLDDSTEKCLRINTGMLGKANIFRCNQRMDNIRRKIGIAAVHTIVFFHRECAQHFPVFREDFRCKFIVGIFQLFHRRHIAYPALRNRNKDNHNSYQNNCQ